MNARKTLTGLAALTLFDIAAAQAPVQAQTPNWTGWYIGINAGYRWADVDGVAQHGGFLNHQSNGFFDDIIFSPNSSAFTTSPQNGVYGIHGGYNFLVTRNFLIGWESDINWGKGSSTATVSFSDPVINGKGTATFSATIDWQASLRGRVGYVFGSLMLYGTGGISLMRASISTSSRFTSGAPITSCDGVCFFNATSTSDFTGSKLLAGIVVGTGLEYLLGNNLTFRLEYLFSTYRNVVFGNATVTNNYFEDFFGPFSTTSTASGPVHASFQTQVLRAGISVKIP